jgi:hypothetical protein
VQAGNSTSTFRDRPLPPYPLGPTNLFTVIFLAIESCPCWVSARTDGKLQPERVFCCRTEGRQVDVGAVDISDV